MKKVEEEQRLLSRQQQLEHEKQRLDMEKELLATRYEAEQVQIEVDFSVTGGSSDHTFEALNRLPKQTSCEVVGKYLQSFEDDSCPPSQAVGVSSGFLPRELDLSEVNQKKTVQRAESRTKQSSEPRTSSTS